MIHYIDRVTGKLETEEVYGGAGLHLLYSNALGFPLQYIARTSLFGSLYGYFQKLPFSKRKIKPFVDRFHIDSSEFVKSLDDFTSFNDFFIRHLKPESRPIASSEAIIPADGRYYFYQDIDKTEGFIVKGKKFNLAKLLNDPHLATRYKGGSMVLARLCPIDYHRFHFPCDCIPGESKLINGWLYSVNPVAVKKNLSIFTENKRELTLLQSDAFGQILFMEVGATCVGSIHQTYEPQTMYKKGDEKGYFSFGGSALVILFEPGRIVFDADLCRDVEVRCLMGQSMGQKQR